MTHRRAAVLEGSDYAGTGHAHANREYLASFVICKTQVARSKVVSSSLGSAIGWRASRMPHPPAIHTCLQRHSFAALKTHRICRPFFGAGGVGGPAACLRAHSKGQGAVGIPSLVHQLAAVPAG